MLPATPVVGPAVAVTITSVLAVVFTRPPVVAIAEAEVTPAEAPAGEETVEEETHLELELLPSGTRVRVRGWIERRNGPYIELFHPLQIEALSDETLPPSPGIVPCGGIGSIFAILARRYASASRTRSAITYPGSSPFARISCLPGPSERYA